MTENDTTFEELIEEYLEMSRDGTAPGTGDFAKLHPEYEERLSELLPLMMRMEGCAAESRRNRANPAADEFPDMEGSGYRLLRKIGAGGMGEVFEAVQVSLNRKVAVKLLSPSLTVDPAQREQFNNEAHVIAMLHHPNIVKIYSAGVCDERCYYAMELIDGKGLGNYRKFAPREIARMGLQAAKALAYAHGCGVLHCDIKPANLLLDACGDIHIGDFGLAFVLKDAPAPGEKKSMISGTLRYMPPERIRHGIKNFAGDQYSFGVTLYELVTGAPVLQEHDRQKLIDRICAGPLPPLKCAEPDLAAIVNKCVSFDPADRYPNMEKAAEDLERFLHHEPVSAARTSVIRRFRLWSKRKPAVAALSVLALTSFAGLAVAVTVGYIRTNAALKLAERNAAAANAALSDIFAHIEERTPSASGSELLSRLMPYYQEIAEQRNLPQSQIADMNLIIGTAAMRSGNYPLAERAFRRANELRPDANTLIQLATALRQQGKTIQADQTAHLVIEEYPESCEAVRSYLSLGDYDEAFALVRSLLAAKPDDPDYLFQYALLLETRPSLAETDPIEGIQPDPAAIISRLTEQYDNRLDFALALVDLMCGKLGSQTRFTQQDRKALEQALSLSDRLLARFPNTPEVASSVVKLENNYIARLRRAGDQAAARKESARLQGMLEILYSSPDAPDEVKETLLAMQMEQLEQIGTPTRAQNAVFQELVSKIGSELKDYHGDRLEEFRDALARLSARAPAAAGRSGPGPGRMPNIPPGRLSALQQSGRQNQGAQRPNQNTQPGRQPAQGRQQSMPGRQPGRPRNGESTPF